jgi:hypothetical protein
MVIRFRQRRKAQTEAVDKVNELLGSIDLDMDHVLGAAQVNRAKDLVKEYVCRESSAVALIDGLLAKAGITVDALIVAIEEAARVC